MNSMLKAGTRYLSGTDEATFQNIAACAELSRITRTSMGPCGLFKMILNHLEKLIVTKNASAISTEIEVKHPAAKMLVMAAQNQALEYGDGTNLVIALAGELLICAESLLQQGIVVADVISGYEKAFAVIQEELRSEASPIIISPVTVSTKEGIVATVRSALSAKQYGNEDVLAPLVADACSIIMRDGSFNPENVRVAKVSGQSIADSFVVRGFVIPAVPRGTVDFMKDCRIAVYGCAIELDQTETKGTVLLESASELVGLSASEEKAMEDRIKAFHDAGVNVLVSQMSFHELATHFCNKYGIMAVKIGSKFEVRRFAQSVGAQLLMTFRVPAEDKLGFCGEMRVDEIGDKKVIICRDGDDYRRPTRRAAEEDIDEAANCRDISTIIVRAATQNVLSDVASAIGNAVNVAKAACVDSRMVPGAGAAEMYLATKLRAIAQRETGLEQYSIRAFAEALETVPRILAETSGLLADVAMAQLQAQHVEGRSMFGINIEAAGSDASYCLDAAKEKIYDNLGVKLWAFRMACDAACSVLRVDQVIMRKQAGGPKPQEAGQQQWN